MSTFATFARAFVRLAAAFLSVVFAVSLITLGDKTQGTVLLATALLLVGILLSVAPWQRPITPVAGRAPGATLRAVGTSDPGVMPVSEIMSSRAKVQVVADGLDIDVNRSVVGYISTMLDEEATDEEIAAAIRAISTDAPDFSNDRRARHEAAHALVSALCGHSVESADIRTGVGDVGGNVSTSFAQTGTFSDVMLERMMVSEAGRVVDLEAGHRDIGSRNDMDESFSCAMSIISADQAPTGFDGELSPVPLLAHAATRAAELIDQHRDALDDLGKALADAPGQTMSGREVHAVLARHGIRPLAVLAGRDHGGTRPPTA